MLGNEANNSPSPNDDAGFSASEYLRRASQAYAAGNPVLAMHLYMAAFERGKRPDGTAPDEDIVDGMKRAWRLACSLKERSMAEYVFERMEPYLSNDETEACAEQLQDLALDKLEEFGLSREDLEDMTDVISQDLLGGDARILRVEHVDVPMHGLGKLGKPAVGDAGGADGAGSAGSAKTVAASDSAQISDGPRGGEGAHGDSDEEPMGTPSEAARDARASEAIASASQAISAALVRMGAADDKEGSAPAPAPLTYKQLAGYDDAVDIMHDFGIGMRKDEAFQQLVEQLNKRHGLDRMPATDSLLFRSPAREDASRFMTATIGELGLPVIRMRMEENLQGMPILCVMSQAGKQPKLNGTRNAFEGPGILTLEDLDLWTAPNSDQQPGDDFGGFLLASLSRGAREAVSLIRSAVADPEVYVLASAAEGAEIDTFFLDLLEPMTLVDIDYPSDKERADIWMDIAKEHPSIRGVDPRELVRLSASMPRYDIYMAAREAVEEAYKASLAARRYIPVTKDNLFDKLAAYQPLDSKEYKELEEAVVSDFRRGLDNLDDLLNGGAE